MNRSKQSEKVLEELSLKYNHNILFTKEIQQDVKNKSIRRDKIENEIYHQSIGVNRNRDEFQLYLSIICFHEMGHESLQK